MADPCPICGSRRPLTNVHVDRDKPARCWHAGDSQIADMRDRLAGLRREVALLESELSGLDVTP